MENLKDNYTIGQFQHRQIVLNCAKYHVAVTYGYENWETLERCSHGAVFANMISKVDTEFKRMLTIGNVLKIKTI